MKILALKVDVDTHRGYTGGVPRLMDLFGELGIEATFFFSMGPDNSGQAIIRIFRPGFLTKMRRTSAVSTYGIKTMLYGTLLPAPMIVESAPWVIKRCVSLGHECGIHAWDHVKWQDRLERLHASTIEADFKKAAALFVQKTGTRPVSCAAPGWQVSDMSLRVQDELGLVYSSDTRGACPFLPRLGHRTFNTPQIPSTLPTMDELLGVNGLTGSALAAHLYFLLGDGLNVYTLHAEMEGMGELETFKEFITRAKAEGVRFVTLLKIAQNLNIADLPVCTVDMRPTTGRSGNVATQVFLNSIRE